MTLDITVFDAADARNFLQELMQLNRLSGPALGVAKQVMGQQGTAELSSAQSYTLSKAVEPHVFDGCARCGETIPWSEMLAAADNGRICGWCYQMTSKEADE